MKKINYVFYPKIGILPSKFAIWNFSDKKDIQIETQSQYELSTDNINNITSNIMSMIEAELLKKANLDQLNFALETQAKLNEAFSSATRISRFCWDSEGILSENKYIKVNDKIV